MDQLNKSNRAKSITDQIFEGARMKLFPKLNIFGILNYPFGITATPFMRNNFIRNLDEIPVRPSEKALYIRIPFCKSKCFFCPFHTYISSELFQKEFVKHLLQEIAMYAKTEYVKKSKFGAIYLGGGTPTILTNSDLLRIIRIIKDNFTFGPNLQLTLETSLASVDIERLHELKEAGVNRVTFGIQTFNEEIAKNINLPQIPSKNLYMIEETKELFKDISMDIIFGLPEQTNKRWEEDVRAAISTNVKHISMYPLNILPGTVLWENYRKDKITKRTDDEYIDMFERAHILLKEAHFFPYSMSDYCLKGDESKYFLIHSERQDDLLAIGPGASGFVNATTYINYANLSDYFKTIDGNQLPMEFARNACFDALKRRFFVIGLRNLRIDRDEYHRRFRSNAFEDFSKELTLLVDHDLIELCNNWIKIPEKRLVWTNNIRALFC